MIERLFAAYIFDILTLLADDVFTLSPEKREQQIRSYFGDYRGVVTEYLVSVPAKTLVTDLSRLSSGWRTRSAECLELVSVFVAFLTIDVVTHFEGDVSVDTSSSKSYTMIELSRLVSSGSISHTEVAAFLRQVGSSVAMQHVQLPCELASEDRAILRSQLGGFTTFSLDSSLLGGLKLFADGYIRDHSWRGSLTSYFSSLS